SISSTSSQTRSCLTTSVYRTVQSQCGARCHPGPELRRQGAAVSKVRRYPGPQLPMAGRVFCAFATYRSRPEAMSGDCSDAAMQYAEADNLRPHAVRVSVLGRLGPRVSTPMLPCGAHAG